MSNIFRIKILIFVIFSFLFGLSKTSLAASTDNVYGYAWNTTTGLISMNCTNDDTCPADYFELTFPYTFGISYGVNLDPSSGAITGNAWSANSGWIDFAPSGPYPSSPDYSTTYDSITGAVTGWAQITSLGSDGWIAMSGIWSDDVTIATSTSENVFRGRAYNEASVGYIYFNCLDSGTCETNDFAVKLNNVPTVSNMTAPNWSADSACSNGAKKALLTWDFDDDDGSVQAYRRVVVSTTNNYINPTVIDTGKTSSSLNYYVLNSDDLYYETSYYWWVEVWDEADQSSGLIQYNSDTDTHNDDSNNNTFTTYAHEFPNVDFEWSPSINTPIGEDIAFTASVTTYGGTTISSYDWDVPDDTTISSEIVANPTINYQYYGNQWARLTATDSDGFACSLYQNVSTTNQVSDFAWSEKIGWGSFNCSNDDSCATADYSVKINSTANIFSGYAWNDNVGWISFESTSTPPDNYNFNRYCEYTCNASNNCTACYNSTSGQVYGWAKIVSMGDSGWLSLSCYNDGSCSHYDYGLSIDSETGYFSGYAWNDNDYLGNGIGWISFNCANDSNDCTGHDYHVQVYPYDPLDIMTMSAPNWSASEACSVYGAKRAILRWTINTSSQKNYQIIIDDDPVIDNDTVIFDTGKATSTANQYACPNSVDGCDLNYDTVYYWWLKLWDVNDNNTGWLQFDTNEKGTITDNTNYNSNRSPYPNQTFTTYMHEFPEARFSWSPSTLTINQDFLFTSNSEYYTTSLPISSASCASTTCTYLWECDDDTVTLSNTDKATSTIQFTNSLTKSIDLTVTDNDGYSCSTSTESISNTLPTWKEVKSE